MALQWFHWAHISATLFTVPLYVLIMVVILMRKGQKQFDALLLSQGAADILSLLVCDVDACLRKSGIADNFFWEIRSFFPKLMVSWFNYSINLRCIGITMISVQRYVTICKGRTKIETFMEKIPLYVLVCVHWLFAFVAVAPYVTLLNVIFVSQENLTLMPDPHRSQKASFTRLPCAIACLLTSTICYTFVINYVRQCAPWRKRQAWRLTVQFSGLVLALLLVSGLYISFLCLPWHIAFPLLKHVFVLSDIILSCVHPWTYFTFNEEVRRKVLNIARCHKDIQGQVTTVTTIHVKPLGTGN